MSILLKGIEMPQENELIIINSNGDIEKVKCDGTTWLCDSKAIELPPHGRLIDADKAAKQGWTISRTYSASPTEMVYEVKKMTDEVLPTIIESEEEK